MSLNRHPYHLVDPSPWPLFGGTTAFFLTTFALIFFHIFSLGTDELHTTFTVLIFVMLFWWRDVVREAAREGYHTSIVILGLKMGMLLFILSEVMFFSAFFWGFFHSSLVPTPELGSIWPPVFVESFGAWKVPFLNTLLLLGSGAAVTWAHHGLQEGQLPSITNGLLLTIILALIFTGVQGFEYFESPFDISDAAFGTTFFLATGFHGLHVIIGTTFLIICYLRARRQQYTEGHHFGFEAAAWYWHFVDVVWLFLFFVVYWWGGK